MIALHAILLLITFYLLAKIVDNYFIHSLEIISAKLKLSSDVAGATFMALGSSAPELFISFLALFRVSEEMSIGSGTIVGSAIFNILVIIGASALYRRATLTWQPVIRDLLFYIISIILLLLIFRDGQITAADSIYLVLIYVVYLFSFKFWKKWFPYEMDDDFASEMVAEGFEEIEQDKKEGWGLTTVVDKLLAHLFFDLKKNKHLYFVNFLISISMLGLLTHLMVESAVYIAHYFNIPTVIIGLTILAAGTSIPDLLSSINVAKKGLGDMAIANAVGSNIFDIAIGLGLPWLFITLYRGGPLPVDTQNLWSSMVLLFSTVIALLFLLIAKKWEIGRYAGILLISFYITYVLFQIGLLSMTFCLQVGGGYCLAL